MNIRRFFASITVVAGLLAGAAIPVFASTPAASASACVTTHTYRYSVTSSGSRSWEWLTEIKCGKNYQQWEHLISRYSTGSHADATIYKNEYAYPHYYRHEVRRYWTASGTYSIKTTNTSA